METIVSTQDVSFIIAISSCVFLFFIIQLLLNNRKTINIRKKRILEEINMFRDVFISQLYNGTFSKNLDLFAFVLLLFKVNDLELKKKNIQNRFSKINIDKHQEKNIKSFVDCFVIDLFKFEDKLGRELNEKDIFRFVRDIDISKYKKINISIKNEATCKKVNGKDIVKTFKSDKECFNINKTKLYFNNTFKRESQLIIHAIKTNKNIEIIWNKNDENLCIDNYVVSIEK